MDISLKEINIPYSAVVTGKKIVTSIPAVIHTGINNGVIIINYPGANGNIDGYENKYLKIANMLVEKKLGTVIRIANEQIDGTHWETTIQEVLQHTIEYALEHSAELCGNNSPSLYLKGTSAGASAIAAVCSLYPEVKKVLLISPSADAGWEAMENGLFGYQNELYITTGEDDIYIGMEMAPLCKKVAVNASINKLITIPNCDHQFRGKDNGLIFSKAPLWAFAGDATYPSSEGGILLYE